MIELVEDTGGIDAIRAGVHRYVSFYDADNKVMHLKQLKDTNSLFYVDGTSAPISENDVFVKFPKFFHKAVEVESDIWEVSFLCSETPRQESGWNEWDSNRLLGAYKTNAYQTLYSRSGLSLDRTYSTEQTMPSVDSLLKSKGEHFGLVSMDDMNILFFMFLAVYRRFDASIIGSGNYRSKAKSGVSDSIGVADSVEGNDYSSFLGLEDIRQEQILYGSLAKAGKIVNADKPIMGINGRELNYTDTSEQYKYVTKILIGEHLDVIPKELNGTSSTGYKASFYTAERQKTTNCVVKVKDLRQYTIVEASDNFNVRYAHFRLTYNGDHVIES